MVGNKNVIFVAVAQLEKGTGIIQQDIGIDDIRFALGHRILFYSGIRHDRIILGFPGGRNHRHGFALDHCRRNWYDGLSAWVACPHFQTQRKGLRHLCVAGLWNEYGWLVVDR